MIHELRILADDEKKTVTVLDGDGNVADLPGVIVFGGDALMGARFCFAYGSSSDMAWAAAQAYGLDSVPMRRFFRQLSSHIAQSVDPAVFQNELTEDEAIAMWGEQKRDRSH